MRLRPALILASLLWLSCLSLAAFAAQPVSKPAPLVAGVDYVVIENGQPWRPLEGKIEVAEVFAYWCHHCANLQPQLEAWKAKLPADVRLSYVPLPQGEQDMLARAYFAAESLGVLGQTHAATFRAIHADQALPKNPSAGELANHVAGLGIDRKAWQGAMQGFEMGSQLRRAYRFAIDSGAPGTPTLVIDGRYRVTGRTLDDLIRIADQLVRQQRAAR